MGIQVRSSARAGKRRSAFVFRACVATCVLLSPFCEAPAAFPPPQRDAHAPKVERIHLQVIDSRDDHPLSGATVVLIYWQKNKAGIEKKEIDILTDENGKAQFEKIGADKFPVNVSAKGFRSCWRWLRIESLKTATRIQLERWAERSL